MRQDQPANGAVEARYAALKELIRQDETGPRGGQVVDELLQFLGDESWRIRKAAVRVVTTLEDPGVEERLVAALATDTNVGLRAACAEALTRMGDRVIGALGAGTKHSDPNLRKVVAEVLGAIGTEAARAVLGPLLTDDDANVRAAAAEALGRIGGDDIIEVLWNRLVEAGDVAQEAAYLLEALLEAGAKCTLVDLRPWLPRTELTRQILPLLGQGGDPEAIMPLVDALTSARRSARLAAVVALEQLCSSLPESGREAVGAVLRGRESAAEILLAAAQSGTEAVARAAVRLLGLVGRPDMMPAVIQACASRAYLGTAMECAVHAGPEVVEPLLDSLYALDPEARILALEVIEGLGDARAMERCLEVARGVDMRSAEAALRALGRFGTDECIWPLVDIASMGDPDLRRHAGLALVAVGSRFPDEVATAVRRRMESMGPRPALLLVLGAIGRRSDMTVLRAAMTHSSSDVRSAALDAAAAHLETFDTELFVFALADEAPEVRVAAARALGEHRSGDVERALLVALRDRDPWVVAAAADSLGRVGGAAVVEPLMEYAASPSAAVAMAALQSLFRLNARGLPEALRRACRHPESEVVNEVIRACLRLDDGKARELLTSLLGHAAWDVRRGAAEALCNRGLSVPAELVDTCLERESVPLVVEELEKLASMGERS